MAPLHDRGRDAGGHGDDVPVCQAEVQGSAGGVRHLQLVQEVLAAGRRPVRAKGDGHARGPGGHDVAGAAIEHQVAERRPDHRAAVLSHHREVGRLQSRAMDAGQGRGDRPLAPVLQGEERVAGRSVQPLAQMQQQARGLAKDLVEAGPLLGDDVEDVGGGLGESRADRVVHHPHRAVVRGVHRGDLQRNALAGGHPAQQALGLHVAGQGG